MSFLNSFIFPREISMNAQGGPRWATEVTINDGGYETRNQPWSYPLHDYDVGWGVKTVPDLELIVSAFHGARGMLHAFRYEDPLDWKSCTRDDDIAEDDQTLIASADGGETSIQLIKTYTYTGGASMSRKITRPFDTVLLAINGATKTEGTHFTVDDTTGLIDLTGGTSPHGALTLADTVTAGFHFHVPVRFNTNSLPIRLGAIHYGETEIPLVEVRE